MYRNTKFLEVLHEIRQNISEEFDFDLMRLAKSLQDKSECESQTETSNHGEEKIISETDLATAYGNGI